MAIANADRRALARLERTRMRISFGSNAFLSGSLAPGIMQKTNRRAIKCCSHRTGSSRERPLGDVLRRKLPRMLCHLQRRALRDRRPNICGRPRSQCKSEVRHARLGNWSRLVGGRRLEGAPEAAPLTITRALRGALQGYRSRRRPRMQGGEGLHPGR